MVGKHSSISASECKSSAGMVRQDWGPDSGRHRSIKNDGYGLFKIPIEDVPDE